MTMSRKAVSWAQPHVSLAVHRGHFFSILVVLNKDLECEINVDSRQ